MKMQHQDCPEDYKKDSQEEKTPEGPLSSEGGYPLPPESSPEKKEKTISLQEYEDLMSRIKELEGMKERLLRGAADFENAKKRLAKEREEFLKYGQENLLRSLLPVLDNFERALNHAGEDPAVPKNFFTGIQRVFKQMTEILKSQGLERLKVLGAVFDPHLHEAMAYVPGNGRDHEIIEEVEAGYVLNGRLLRAAKVKVQTAADSKESTDKNPDSSPALEDPNQS